MRRVLSFACEGNALAATLDDAPGDTGLLIVSGGNEIRIGAHRGMAKLAADIASAGHPVFRFDRRGIGDSEGQNGGYRSSGPDVHAALKSFRAECPHLKQIVCFGNCDAATALVFAELAVKRLVLANPWVFAPVDDLPPPAAIKSLYRQRLRDPKAWIRLFTGAIDFKKAVSGLARIARPRGRASLAEEFEMSMKLTAIWGTEFTILLAARDATAIAFEDAWQRFELVGSDSSIVVELVKLDSASHSFASADDYSALKETVMSALA